MTSPSPSHRPVFMTPLSRADLFDPGQVFPRTELLRRVLSFFWRECCVVPRFSRAPAPVVELSSETDEAAGAALRRVRAWWLLCDGIIEEADGPDSERVELFFGAPGRPAQLWPRYEFRVLAEPLVLEMRFYSEPQSERGSRVRLEAESDGRVRVVTQEPWRDQ